MRRQLTSLRERERYYATSNVATSQPRGLTRLSILHLERRRISSLPHHYWDNSASDSAKCKPQRKGHPRQPYYSSYRINNNTISSRMKRMTDISSSGDGNGNGSGGGTTSTNTNTNNVGLIITIIHIIISTLARAVVVVVEVGVV